MKIEIDSPLLIGDYALYIEEKTEISSDRREYNLLICVVEEIEYFVSRRETFYHLTDINGKMRVCVPSQFGRELFLYNQIEPAKQALIKFKNSEGDHVD